MRSTRLIVHNQDSVADRHDDLDLDDHHRARHGPGGIESDELEDARDPSGLRHRRGHGRPPTPAPRRSSAARATTRSTSSRSTATPASRAATATTPRRSPTAALLAGIDAQLLISGGAGIDTTYRRRHRRHRGRPRHADPDEPRRPRHGRRPVEQPVLARAGRRPHGVELHVLATVRHAGSAGARPRRHPHDHRRPVRRPHGRDAGRAPAGRAVPAGGQRPAGRVVPGDDDSFATTGCGTDGTTGEPDSRCSSSVFVWASGRLFLIGFRGELHGLDVAFTATPAGPGTATDLAAHGRHQLRHARDARHQARRRRRPLQRPRHAAAHACSTRGPATTSSTSPTPPTSGRFAAAADASPAATCSSCTTPSSTAP